MGYELVHTLKKASKHCAIHMDARNIRNMFYFKRVTQIDHLSKARQLMKESVIACFLLILPNTSRFLRD